MTANPMTETKVAFSLTFEIGGEPIPLTSQEITKKMTEHPHHGSPAGLDHLIKQGLSFKTPGGWELQVALSHLEHWLAGHHFEIPDFIKHFLDETLSRPSPPARGHDDEQ